MTTATIPLTGERVGSMWIDGSTILVKGSEFSLSSQGVIHRLIVISIADEGVEVRKKSQADYEREETKSQAKVGIWGKKK